MDITAWNGQELVLVHADAVEGMSMLGAGFNFRIAKRFLDAPMWFRMHTTWALMMAGF